MSILTTYAPAAASSVPHRRQGVFARFMEAMYEARMRKALRVIEEHRHLIADLSDERVGTCGRR